MKITPELLTRLVNLLVTKNGEGHKELESLLEDGEISEKDAELIKLRANTLLLSYRLDEVNI